MLLMAEAARIKGLAHSGDGDPFGILGMHRIPEGGLVVRAFRPKAESLELIDARTGAGAGLLARVHPEGVFSLELPQGEPFPYRFRENDGLSVAELEDPYRFGKVLSDADTWLIRQGEHPRLWEVLGAHLRELEGVRGTAFAVWAPNARRVSVVGDFNDWDGRVHAMRLRRECGVWEIFIPVELAGNHYKYEIVGPDRNLLPLRADPVGFAHELRPATASIVVPPSTHVWGDALWLEQRAETSRRDRPIAIYEVHLGSWRRKGEGDSMLTYGELADTLLPYVRELGFTHVELLPITEHPFDGSWGYQTTGMFAPTSRHGSPDDFRVFVDRAHAQGIGVILDWVPGHFPADTHGLVYFDGTHLYEHMDRRKGFHFEWGTYSYNFERVEVSNFLIASALFWLDQLHIDGLRVDAVSSIVYLDYGRQYGEWLPNLRGGNENLEAVAFLRRFNTTVYREFPSAMTIAEESTAFPMVSWPIDSGGLGFGYKWNMGWMHDTLRFFSVDPLFRGHHLNEVSFGIWYAWTENFILSFSHDEVVHLKRSLLGRMPGDDERRFASLRALYAFMYTHPGKKLMFMGGEFAQEGEWNESSGSLDWEQLEDDPRRQGVHALVRDLNRFYRESPALYQGDAEPAGFEWIDCTDPASVVISFLRRDPQSGAFLVVVLNASGVAHHDYRIGVPQGGAYQERLNTDAELYGGRTCGNPGELTATEPGAHGRPYALSLTLPPQAVIVLEPDPNNGASANELGAHERQAALSPAPPKSVLALKANTNIGISSFTEDPVRAMAYHQAAHAVALWALLPETTVLPIIVASEETNSTEHAPFGRGQLRDRLHNATWSERRHLLECYIMATMVGAITEKTVTGHSRPAPADYDADLVAELTSRLSSSAPGQIAYESCERRLVTRAERLVAELWRKIDAVARAVLERGALNEHEFHQILQNV